MSINQSRVDYCGAGMFASTMPGPTCPSIRAASTTAAPQRWPKKRVYLRVHQSEPRRLLRRQSTYITHNHYCVSINQSRVDYCGAERWHGCVGVQRVHQSEPRRLLRRGESSRVERVAAGVHQSEPRRLLRRRTAARDFVENAACPSIRAASTTAACRPSKKVSKETPCPSIRAASTTAATRLPSTRGGGSRVHQSEPRRLLRRCMMFHSRTLIWVSINQSRVDYCGIG